MNNVDLPYICKVIGNLSGIPVRIFHGKELSFYHSVVYLPQDPMYLYQDPIFAISDHVGYFVTPHFNYYGIVNTDEYKLIIGPTRQIVHNKQELYDLAFRMDIPKDQVADFVSGMQSIAKFPLDSVVQILCVVNYILNGEKLGLEDISIYDIEQDVKKEMVIRNFERRSGENIDFLQMDVHNSFSVEQTVTHIVQMGDTDAFKQWIASAPTVRAGVIATDQLRQMKNIFVVTATLASRAAIRGGMDAEDALSLSDAFIQKCELLNDMKRITTLQYHMILEFTQTVERIRHNTYGSPLVIQVANYIRHHLSESVTVEAIARHLFLSRPYLSAKFKAETGVSLTDFILQEKTEEAKRLLCYSDKSFMNISDYLGFSSQSHFSKVFKKYSGYTPKEYREKYIR